MSKLYDALQQQKKESQLFIEFWTNPSPSKQSTFTKSHCNRLVLRHQRIIKKIDNLLKEFKHV